MQCADHEDGYFFAMDHKKNLVTARALVNTITDHDAVVMLAAL